MTGHLKSCVGPMSESAREAIGVWVNKWYYTLHPAKTTQKHARSIKGSTSTTLDSLVQQYNLKRLNDLHTTLMLAFVTAGVPFNFANNTFFRKYQLMLGGSHYSAPSRTRLSSDLLVKKAASIRYSEKQEILSFVKRYQGRPFTVVVDGWKDCTGKHNSMVYLMNTKGMLFFGGFTEPVEYSGSPELGESLEMFLIECGFTWERVVCALCIDSSSVMVGMRNWFVENIHF
eukprot:Nk52_evm21s210 gene=Nk52_evmTU21s210